MTNTVVFLDKQGQTVSIGNKLVSDANIEANVVSQATIDIDGLDVVVLFVQQVKDPLAFSYLTADNLALQFAKVNA